jgi:hypothetical protein
MKDDRSSEEKPAAETPLAQPALIDLRHTRDCFAG